MSRGEQHAGYSGELNDRGRVEVRQDFGDLPTTEPILNMPADRARELAYAILRAVDEDRNPDPKFVVDEISNGAALAAVRPKVSVPAIHGLSEGEPTRYTEPGWPVDFVIRMEPTQSDGVFSVDEGPDPDDVAERVDDPEESEPPEAEA